MGTQSWRKSSLATYAKGVACETRGKVGVAQDRGRVMASPDPTFSPGGARGLDTRLISRNRDMQAVSFTHDPEYQVLYLAVL